MDGVETSSYEHFPPAVIRETGTCLKATIKLIIPVLPYAPPQCNYSGL